MQLTDEVLIGDATSPSGASEESSPSGELAGEAPTPVEPEAAPVEKTHESAPVPAFNSRVVDMSMVSFADIFTTALAISVDNSVVYASPSNKGLYLIDIGDALAGRTRNAEDLPMLMFTRPIPEDVLAVVSHLSRDAASQETPLEAET